MLTRNELKPGQKVQVTIADLTHKGQGVTHIEDYPIFIPQSLPGEEIIAEITHLGQHIGHARIIDILKESPDRMHAYEEADYLSSTMPLRHLAYPAQLAFKREQVRRVFQKNAGLDLTIPAMIGADSVLGYRNKAQIPVQQVDGQLATGIFKAGTHQLIPTEDFKIQDPEIDRIIIKVRDIMRHYQISPYDEKPHSGDLRHIIVRRGHYTGEVMIVLVTRTFTLPHRSEIVCAINEQIPDTVSLIQNINNERTNVILGRQAMVLAGQDYYTDQINHHQFKISHQSFFQVNTVQTEKLYQVAVDFAELTGRETVIDAYCGIGTLSIALAEHAKHVYGVEIVPDAIQNAKENAKINQIDHLTFEAGAAEKWMAEKQAQGLKADVIVVDPPRKGLDKSFIEAAVQMGPKKIVYVSCNPATQSRDVQLFMENGYTLRKIQPVDMFPMSHHIESVVLMTRML